MEDLLGISEKGEEGSGNPAYSTGDIILLYTLYALRMDSMISSDPLMGKGPVVPARRGGKQNKAKETSEVNAENVKGPQPRDLPGLVECRNKTSRAFSLSSPTLFHSLP
jgi:hypothetical protein